MKRPLDPQWLFTRLSLPPVPPRCCCGSYTFWRPFEATDEPWQCFCCIPVPPDENGEQAEDGKVLMQHVRVVDVEQVGKREHKEAA